MQWKWGSHIHRIAEVGPSINKKTLFTDAGTPWAEEVTILLNGTLISQQTSESAARAEIKTKQEALEAAYAVNDRDTGLLFPDGTASFHDFPVANTVGGTRVVQPPSFTNPTGVEGVTISQYQIGLGLIVPMPTAQLATAYKSFEETLEFQPAGAKYGHIETKLGRPIKQQLRRFQTYRARQTGSAVGLYTRPTRPNPLWPFSLVNTEPLLTYGHPRRIGSDYVDWPLAWQWDFEAAFPLTGRPHVWGAASSI